MEPIKALQAGLATVLSLLCFSAAAAPVGLGAVLTSGGGQIYGFDINQGGDDGFIATSNGGLNTVETFDQNSGKITKTVISFQGQRNEYSGDGIFAGDVALITHYITPEGQIYARRKYLVMNPVTGGKITGAWTPPLKDIDVLQASTDQASSTSAIFAIELKNQDRPDLIISDVAANTFSKIVHLDPNLFGGADGPKLGQFTAVNKAVFALSPDAGAVFGQPPVNVLIDLSSGKIKQFTGYNNGTYHAGSVDGLAVDPNTGIAATTTELNAQVEFYDLKKQKGIAAVQLPCSGDTDQLLSGSGIAVDPVNKLFLVTETNYCQGDQGSAINVYDESGNFVETITGFKFFIGEPPPVLNPSKRMGWTFGGPNGANQLQQFFY